MAIPQVADLPREGGGQPEGFWYQAKRRLLGPPLVNEQLGEQRLSKPFAIGVLSCDGISSAAYGSEEMLIELIQGVGVAAFALLLPMTLVVLVGIALVVLSYREVVTVYTRAGGSYVVARDNFGPRVAQVAAVALLIDYVVTVAVQVSAGSSAIVSAIPSLANVPIIGSHILLEISVISVLIMCYGNLRGVREAAKGFALPTYLFSVSVALLIIVGLIREVTGGLGHVHHYTGPTYPFGHSNNGLMSAAMIFILLRAFANGGSSLTGIEAVSNAVSALKPPEGRNARQILVTQGSIVAFLIAGISWLAHVTHAAPYLSGFPTVLAQEADLVFGHPGHFMFYVVQLATALILFTGGNTSFSGFPFLASFVAEDSFLPRWLTKRGHRLVFSNGIIILTVISLTLLLTIGANVNALVPLYAIGVFTGFSMAGFGMCKYHLRTKEPGWRRRFTINLIGAIYTALVVLIFAVVKFTEGAWIVVVVAPILVYVLIRLNREYRDEAEVLRAIGTTKRNKSDAGIVNPQPNYTRRIVLVFVDDYDLATIAAIRYAKSLRPTALRAVHFVMDNRQAERLRTEWQHVRGVPLDFVDTPDRRLTRAAEELVAGEAAAPGTQVTVILPRRSYSALTGRLLHDRTADKIAGVVSHIPNAAATIIPFDVQNRVRVLQARQVAKQAAGEEAARAAGQSTEATDTGPADGAASELTQTDINAELAAATPDNLATLPGAGGYIRPNPPKGVNPIGSLTQPGRAIVEGRVRIVEIRPVERNSVLVCEISDSTGDLTAMFYGREHIPGLMCGSRVRLKGTVGFKDGHPVMVNPKYELIVPGTASGHSE